MATQWISPTWRMPENSNQSKVDNYSLDFDGSSQNIDLGTQPIVTGIFSISMWIKRNSTSVGDSVQIMIGKDGSSSNRVFNVYFQNIGGSISFWVSSTGAYSLNYRVDTSTLIDDTDWHHIVLINNGDSVNNQIFIDGVEASYASQKPGRSTLYDDETVITSIGGDSSTGTTFNFNGKIGPVSMFDSALSVSQITALYNSGTPVNPMALTPIPIAYYPLGGGSTGDAAVSSPATLTVPNESVPSATVFNFTSGYVNANIGNLPTDYTLAFWVQGPMATNAKYVISKGTVGSGASDGLGLRALTNIQWYQNTTSGGNKSMIIGAGGVLNLSTSNWYHVVLRYSSTTGMSSYINGVADDTYSTGSPWGAPNPDGNPLSLGTYNSATGWVFEGNLSNVCLFDYILPATGTESVESLYNNGSPNNTISSWSNLKACWKLDVDTSTWDGTNWEIGDARSSYTSSIATTNGGFVTPNTNLSDFMGNSATNFSWSMWVRNTAGDTSSSGLVKWSYPAASLYDNSIINYNFYGGIALVLNSTNRIGFGAINDGEWKHVLMTVDTNAGATWDDCVKCFINGEAQTSTNVAGSPPASFDWLATFAGTPSNQRRVNVGSGGSTSGFHGDISNFTLYNSTLGQTEATALYNNGIPVTTAVGSPTAWWKVNNLTSGLSDVSGNSYDITTEGSGQVVTDGLVSAFNGESTSMTTANLVTSDLTRSIPYSSYSMFFDGYVDDDEINLNSAYTTTDQFSVSLWANSTSPFPGGADYGYYIGENAGGAAGYGFAIVQSTGGAFSQGIIYAFFGSAPEALTSTAVTPGVWEHIVFLCDKTVGTNGEIKLYRNGVLDTTTTLASTDLNDLTAIEHIGSNGYDPHAYAGNLSNVAIWSSHLTEDQILSIYNGGVPNDISSLSPVSWWSLSGDSYFDGQDWICPDLGSGGNNGTSDNMGGTELIGDGPGSTANGVTTSMDIPANLKGNAPNSTSNAFSVNMTAIDRVTSVPG